MAFPTSILVMRRNPDTLNVDGGILESDRTNNEASKVFQITGDRILVLRSTGYEPPVRYDNGTWATESP